MDAESTPPGAVEFPNLVRLVCPMCASALLPTSRVRVVNISRVEAGWVAHGEIQLVCSCAGCGTAYSEIVQQIPIECASLPCPHCGPGSKLTPDILNITEAGTGYRFAAVLKCEACSKQRRLSKLLGALSKITKVKIGPTGVEVEVKS